MQSVEGNCIIVNFGLSNNPIFGTIISLVSFDADEWYIVAEILLTIDFSHHFLVTDICRAE
jgi:hypothetical protein